MKLSSHGNGKLQNLGRYRKHANTPTRQHANGCYLFCLNRKLPDLTLIKQILNRYLHFIYSKLHVVVVSV